MRFHAPTCIKAGLGGIFLLLGLATNVFGQVPTDTSAVPSGKGNLKMLPDSSALAQPGGKGALKADNNTPSGRSMMERRDDPVGIDRDSLREVKRRAAVADHNPDGAVRRSLLVPGWGQVYNRKIWKVPIIYAGLGAFGFFIVDNNQQFRRYKNEVLCRVDSTCSPQMYDPELVDFDVSNLIANREFHRKFRDMNIIFAALWYTLQAVDAYVDGHMASFDVSDDLTMRLGPSFDLHPLNRKQWYTGFNLTIQLKK
jgi:hypothetical protein